MMNVFKVYGSLVTLANLSLDIPRGKFTCILGPSGAGKSTIVNLLAGYERPDGGEVIMDDMPVLGPSSERTVVFQESALMPWKTVMENTIFGPLIQGKLSAEEAKHKAKKLIIKSGLADFENKYPDQLSGGMQRRAELIRALINEPRVMLMDEPLRGLDAMTRELMQVYLARMYEDTKMTMLLITTEIDEAIFLGDVIYFLTPRPGSIMHKMEIDLPRPRTPGILTSKEFFRYRTEAIDVVMKEQSEA